MNILLIEYQYKEHFDDFRFKNFSYGLENIKNHCQNNNIKIKTQYQNNKFLENFIPEIIGISLKFNILYIKEILEYILLIKNKFPKSIIVAGGYGAFIKKKELIHYLDAICLGEGEIPFCELINSENKKEYLEKTPYWYINKEDFSFYINDNLDQFKPLQIKREMLPITITRGCTNNCVYCVSYLYKEKKFIFPSLRKVLSDFNFYIKNGIKKFMICDDMPFLNREYWIEILKFLLKNNCKIDILHMHFTLLDKEIIALLSKLYYDKILALYPDAVTEKSMNMTGKNGTFNKLSEVINIAHYHKLKVRCTALVGYPWDTVEDIKNAKKLFKNMGVDDLKLRRLLIYEGSQLHNEGYKSLPNFTRDFL